MKQFIKLIVLMLIGLALSGCYNAQEKEAIEICKKSCKYPLTFEVINTSTSYLAEIGDTTFRRRCYISHLNSVTDSFEFTEYDCDIYCDIYDDDVDVELSRKVNRIINEAIGAIGLDFNFNNVRIDSIRTYTIKRSYPRYTRFEVTYSAKNAFGVPVENSSIFYIIGNYVSDNPRNINDFIRIDTISVNRFINNSPKKIFKNDSEVYRYLHDFESNFKLKN